MQNSVDIISAVVTKTNVLLTVRGQFNAAPGQTVAIAGTPDRLVVQSNVYYPNATSAVQLSTNWPKPPKYYNGKVLTSSFPERTTPGPTPLKSVRSGEIENKTPISSKFVDVQYAIITAVLIFGVYWYYNLRK